MKKKENIFELNEVCEFMEFFYDESSEEGVLRCLPCFRVQAIAKPSIASLCPWDAQRILNKKGNGTLATGLLINKKTTRLLIDGHNDTWYHQKGKCLEHMSLIGEGSRVHKKAMESFHKDKKSQESTCKIVSNIFRAAITDKDRRSWHTFGDVAGFTGNMFCKYRQYRAFQEASC